MRLPANLDHARERRVRHDRNLALYRAITAVDSPSRYNIDIRTLYTVVQSIYLSTSAVLTLAPTSQDCPSSRLKMLSLWFVSPSFLQDAVQLLLGVCGRGRGGENERMVELVVQGEGEGRREVKSLVLR